MLTIIKSGLLTQWTDAGRTQSQVNGYSQAGAIDWFSFQLANALCGNTLNSTALEVMAGNIEFSVSTSCFMSIVGASTDIKINSTSCENKHVFILSANDVVKIGPTAVGVFTYIAFSATFDLPVFANSVCAVKRENIGGKNNDGSAIVDGDRFPFISVNCVEKKALKSFKKCLHKALYTPIIQQLIASSGASI
jgi:allophanate hydrolase subunit 2